MRVTGSALILILLFFTCHLFGQEEMTGAYKPQNILKGSLKSSVKNTPLTFPNGISVPSDFPHVVITNDINPSDEYIFINTRQAPYYNIIFNTSGEPVWYIKTTDRRDDFKIQANGWITMLVSDGYGGSGPGFIAFDNNFEFIKSMRAADGYITDDHDLLVLENNGYILIGQKETTVDMSQYVLNGKTDAIVLETCIQEFSPDDQLLYTWPAWEHFDITDLELESLSSGHIRFPHINAIDLDEDGHLLISSRHLSEISKINRQTGDFIWRWNGIPGSENNDFLFERDPLDGFRNQHSITSLGEQSYLLFDNGNLHSTPNSRAVEYELDTDLMIATMIWESRNEIERGFTGQLGNSQRLENGNTHINWAYGTRYPVAVEITPEGECVFEMWFENGDRCYRSFRFPWNGKIQVPYLILEPQADRLTLIFNKFGDDNVDHYNIYGGRSSEPDSLIGSSSSTKKDLDELETGFQYYFRVTAVDKNGTESGYSNEVNIKLVNTEPGVNLVRNGDFNSLIDPWILSIGNTASAEVEIVDSICNLLIQDGGNTFSDIQLSQNNIPLIKGEKYVLEYNAWSDESRAIEILLQQDQSPYSDYSRIGYTALTKESKQFSFTFKMEGSTDLNARIAINTGSSAGNIYIDDLSLKLDGPTTTRKELADSEEIKLYQNFPNPFNSSTHIDYMLTETAVVGLCIYNSLGQIVEKYDDEKKAAGKHTKIIELHEQESGIYYYLLEVRSVNSAYYSRQTKRMILIK